MQAKGNMLELNAEEIININPDVIIIGRAKSPKAIEEVYANKGLCWHKRSKKQKKSFCKSSLGVF